MTETLAHQMPQLIHLISTRKLKPENKEKLEKLGFTVEDSDFVEIRYTLDANKQRILRENTSPLVLTSGHAIRAIEKIVPELKQKEAFAILGTTTSEAVKVGFTLIGTARDAGNLAEVIANSGPESVLHLTSNIRRNELARWLAEAHIGMQILEVYEKIPNPKKAGEYDAILFWSPSQVDTFLIENSIPENIPAFAIGQTTAHHLEKLWHKNIITASESSEENMIETVIHYFHFLSSR